MLEINGGTRAMLAMVAALLPIISGQTANAADNSVDLKPMTPQVDNSPQSLSTQTPPAVQAPNQAQTNSENRTGVETAPVKIHKLEASKRVHIGDDSDDADGQTPVMPIEENSPTIKRIYINTYTMHATLPATVIQDPFTLMRALLGTRSRDYEKLYAERDTGYGVCGFLMNVPTTKRGYALILKCFPSMPAAQASLQPGDLITAVNGQSTLELPPQDVWDYFTGMPGTEVKIDLLRQNQPFSVTLRRMDIGRIPDFATRAEFLTLFKHNGMSRFVQR